jgi:hypothetical protein
MSRYRKLNVWSYKGEWLLHQSDVGNPTLLSPSVDRTSRQADEYEDQILPAASDKLKLF